MDPKDKLVTVVAGACKSDNRAPPDITDHVPVPPFPAGSAARFTAEESQTPLSGPALARFGVRSRSIRIVSFVVIQTP